jgi:hypothetical protein
LLGQAGERVFSVTLAADTPPEGLERLRAAVEACVSLRSAHHAATPDAPVAVQDAGAGVGVAALGAVWAAEAAEGGHQRVRASGRQQVQQQRLEEHEWVRTSNKVGATNDRVAGHYGAWR